MPVEPQTLTKPELEPCDVEAWNALLVDRPAVALISTRPYLGVLLAKDLEEVHPPRTLLRGVRWVRVPTGWRAAAMRVLARWRPVRLPGEWLFESVALEDRARDDMPLGVAYVANVLPDHPRGLLLPDPSARRYPLKFLTHRQYHSLASAKGRILLARLIEMFRDDLCERHRRRSLLSTIFRAGPARQAVSVGPVFAG